jgi:DNA-binding LytR/AlgR family response regulator
METSKSILIVEDEIIIADYLEDLLRTEGYKKIEKANTLLQAKHQMNTNDFDVILLDINLEGNFEGVDFAKSIAHQSNIIFVTGQTEKHIFEEALKTNPCGFLTKPIKKLDLLAAVKVARLQASEDFIVVADGRDKVKIHIKDILFLNTEKNYTTIYFAKHKVCVRESLKNLSELLPDKNFIQPHRAYLVNKKYIHRKTFNSIFVNGHKIPCSRNFEFEME